MTLTSLSISFDDLYAAWTVTVGVKPRTITETGYAMELLADFLGHKDASRVTKEDVRQWRDASKAAGLANNTWNNRLSFISQVFAPAINDRRLTENPADRTLRLKKNGQACWSPYTDEEACLILEAARLETTPTKRWVHWVMAFSGMRVAEVLQLTRNDVHQVGDVWFMNISKDEAGNRAKTRLRRNVPVHSALIEEGWIAYVATIVSGSLFFKTPDRQVHRNGRSYNVVGRWVRDTVAIDRPGTAPTHSWRQRVDDTLRAAEVPADARDAIMGHTRKATKTSYGRCEEALARLHRDLSKLRVPMGLVIPAPSSIDRPDRRLITRVS
jgi:integrase